MDGVLTLTGEDKIKKFMKTLNNQERLELIEEVERMIELKTLKIGVVKRNSTEYDLMDGY